MQTRTVRFAYGEVCLGLVMAAVGEKGLLAILLGDSKDRLHRHLARTFPAAELIEDTAGLADVLLKVMSVVDHPSGRFGHPLDMQGSEIELAVWQELRRIPAGETRSYGQIAKVLAMAVTAQEVGAACAANVLAVVIPCHRVVKADGSISGYRWGVSRKRRLLAMERAA